MHLHEDPTRTTPTGLTRFAKEFHEAVTWKEKTRGSGPPHKIVAPAPAMYLIGHSIELSLKAFLLLRGISLRDVRVTYGHNLGKTFAKAEQLGLRDHVLIDDAELEAFHALDALYSTKQLEYIVTGTARFPVFVLIHAVSEKLVDAMCPLVGLKR
jgi:hypothetical protein